MYSCWRHYLGKRHQLTHIFMWGLLALATGCTTPNVPSLTSSNHQYGQSEDEKKLLDRAKQFHDELSRKGMLLEAPEMVKYVRQVGLPLIPSQAASIVNFQFHILRSPIVNAFALPDGNIYLSVGLLARLENEAELAQVMAHEIGHVILRHGLKVYETNRSSIVTAHIADLFLFGTSIAYLPYIASIASYSREQEEEADKFGLRSVATQGYNLNASIHVFDLIQEVKKTESIEGSWYSSHPSNKQRANALTEMVRTGTVSEQVPSKVGEVTYNTFSTQITTENIQLKLAARQYELALDAASRALTAHPASAELYYYQGEAYRYMSDDPKGAAREHAWIYGKTFNDTLVSDFEKRRNEFYENAERAYQHAISIDKKFLLAERGLGLIHLRQGNHASAREKLTTYLAKEKNIQDRQYITNLLEGMGK